MPEWLKKGYYQAVRPLIGLFVRYRISPNWFTTLGFLVSLWAAWVLASGSFFVGGLLVFVSGMFDTVDGQVARITGRVTKFGALYDSVLDRYAEAFVFFGLGVFFIRHAMFLTSVAAVLAIGGSLMVSYTRARAEGLGFDCKVGIMQRPERIVLLAASALVTPWLHAPMASWLAPLIVRWRPNENIATLPPIPLTIAIVLIAILANFTAGQRLYHIWREADEDLRKTIMPELPDPAAVSRPDASVPSTLAKSRG